MIHGRKYFMEHKLKESDLVNRLALMSKEEVNAIMCSTKLLSLSIAAGLCSKEQGLKNLDLGQLGTPYTPVSCQVQNVLKVQHMFKKLTYYT